MAIYVGRSAELRMVQMMPLQLSVSCSSNSRLVLPSWHRLTGVVPQKGPVSTSVVVKCGMQYSNFPAAVGTTDND